jgi:hypothetical protein
MIFGIEALSIEFWCFLVVVFLCCLFAIVTRWVVLVIKELNKRVRNTEEKLDEETKQRVNGDVVLGTEVSKRLANIGSQMFQDYKRTFDEMNRKLEEIKTRDIDAREHLKSLANELMARIGDERERFVEKNPNQKQSHNNSPKIDGKESLRRGLEIQKKFTDEYKLGHKNIKRSLKKGEADIVDSDKNGKVSEVVAVKSFELETTEQGKTCRNVKGHKYVVSITPSRDAKAEVETARQNGLSKIRLVVFNLRTGHKIFDGFVSFDEKITIRENEPDN